MMYLLERLFRTLEMIGLLAVTTKLLATRFPWQVNAFVFILGWGASFYALSGVGELLYGHFSNSDIYNHRERRLGSLFVFILSLVVVVAIVHPLVVLIASVPFTS